MKYHLVVFFFSFILMTYSTEVLLQTCHLQLYGQFSASQFRSQKSVCNFLITPARAVYFLFIRMLCASLPIAPLESPLCFSSILTNTSYAHVHLCVYSAGNLPSHLALSWLRSCQQHCQKTGDAQPRPLKLVVLSSFHTSMLCSSY